MVRIGVARLLAVPLKSYEGDNLFNFPPCHYWWGFDLNRQSLYEDRHVRNSHPLHHLRLLSKDLYRERASDVLFRFRLLIRRRFLFPIVGFPDFADPICLFATLIYRSFSFGPHDYPVRLVRENIRTFYRPLRREMEFPIG